VFTVINPPALRPTIELPKENWRKTLRALPEQLLAPNPDRILEPVPAGPRLPQPLHGEVVSVTDRLEPRDGEWLRRLLLALFALILCFVLLPLVMLISILRPGAFSGLMPLVFWRRAEPERLTAIFLTVRSFDTGETHLARIKGRLMEGTAAAGDEIALWGRWRRGILLVSKGENRSTGSSLGGLW
jgi:hypothetical protein